MPSTQISVPANARITNAAINLRRGQPAQLYASGSWNIYGDPNRPCGPGGSGVPANNGGPNGNWPQTGISEGCLLVYLDGAIQSHFDGNNQLLVTGPGALSFGPNDNRLESSKAFAAFNLYLNLGPQRSLAAVAQKLSKSGQLLKRWSTKFEWPARVQAYDAHLAVVEREAAEALARANAAEREKRKQQVREDEWEIRTEALAAGREALKRFYEKGKGATLGDIARMLELASTMGRLSTGLSEKAESDSEDGRPVRIEVTLALEKIYGEPAPGEVVDVQEVAGGNSKLQTSNSMCEPHVPPAPSPNIQKGLSDKT